MVDNSYPDNKVDSPNEEIINVATSKKRTFRRAKYNEKYLINYLNFIDLSALRIQYVVESCALLISAILIKYLISDNLSIKYILKNMFYLKTLLIVALLAASIYKLIRVNSLNTEVYWKINDLRNKKLNLSSKFDIFMSSQYQKGVYIMRIGFSLILSILIFDIAFMVIQVLEFLSFVLSK